MGEIKYQKYRSLENNKNKRQCIVRINFAGTENDKKKNSKRV